MERVVLCRQRWQHCFLRWPTYRKRRRPPKIIWSRPSRAPANCPSARGMGPYSTSTHGGPGADRLQCVNHYSFVIAMNVNALSEIEQARFNMVEQQIRTWLVLDPDVLQAVFDVPRERYVPAAMQSLAFSDIEIPLIIDSVDTHEVMLAPKIEARLAQELQLKPS